MNTAVNLQSEADRLVDLINSDDCFDYDPAEILPRQIEAANERFKARVEQIKLLQNRAETGEVTEVRQMSDMVPLLFAHTAYKSYPEGWLMEGRWDRMDRWLDTVSTYRTPKLDTSNVKGLDEWLALLGEHGHFVSCSSGTTGKCSMMNATSKDLEFCGENLLGVIRAAGLEPNHDARLIGPGQIASTPRNRATGAPIAAAMSPPGVAPFRPDVPPITIGGITEMVVLRKKMTEGTATPSDIAYYDAQVAQRQKWADDAVEQTVDELIKHRSEKLYINGMFPILYKLAAATRARGYGGKDFNPNNMVYNTGGLKRAQLPDNYREIILETFNIQPQNVASGYGMQELNSNSPGCSAGRYHPPPWLMLLLLDESGDHLIEPPKTGEVEGRAGFFDISMDGRWGGVISGDKIHATWAPCACGKRSPSISSDIQRYADMASGDKIACSGTIDAYVRGVA